MNVNECPKCGFTGHLKDSYFCQECGVTLFNECSDEDCDTNNLANTNTLERVRQNAKYCHYCGAKTTFNLLGVFDK